MGRVQRSLAAQQSSSWGADLVAAVEGAGRKVLGHVHGTWSGLMTAGAGMVGEARGSLAALPASLNVVAGRQLLTT